MDCHKQIIEGYCAGMGLKAEDRLIVCDLLPNRLPWLTWLSLFVYLIFHVTDSQEAYLFAGTASSHELLRGFAWKSLHLLCATSAS